MSRALIHSRWREIFDKNKEDNYMPIDANTDSTEVFCEGFDCEDED